MSTRMPLFVLAALILLTGIASADTVTLQNGDRISGEIVGVFEGKLTIKTAYAGDLQVDFASVAGIQSDRDITVFLGTGDKATGKLAPAEGGAITITNPTGTITTPLADVAGLVEHPDGARSELEEEIERLTSPWVGKLELGFYWTDGNTELLGGNFGLSLIRETPKDKFTAKAHVRYAEDGGRKITDEQFISLREDVKFDDFYVFGLFSFERDEFEDLDLRGILAVGVGKVLMDSDTFHLEAEVAPTLNYSDYISRDSQYEAELMLGMRFEWKVFASAKITEELYVYPSLSNGGEYRFFSETAFEQPLSEAWYLKLSIVDQYNSDPSEGFEKNDVSVRLSLVYSF